MMKTSRGLAVFIRIVLVSLFGFCTVTDIAQARSKSRSTAHKQIDSLDPHPGEQWLSQFNLEVDRYMNADYLYTSLTRSKQNWSFQLGGQNIPLTENTQVVPYLYTGLAKQIDIQPWLNLTIGSQVGSYSSGFSFLNYDYLSLGVTQYNLSLAFGPYYANRALTETVSKIGYTLAWSYFFRGFTLSGNYLSGDNNLSGLSANLAYSFNRYLQPYLGFGDVAPNLRCSQCSPYYYMAVGLNLNF